MHMHIHMIITVNHPFATMWALCRKLTYRLHELEVIMFFQCHKPYIFHGVLNGCWLVSQSPADHTFRIDRIARKNFPSWSLKARMASCDSRLILVAMAMTPWPDV